MCTPGFTVQTAIGQRDTELSIDKDLYTSKPSTGLNVMYINDNDLWLQVINFH